MPIMQVRYPEDALDDARKANLARRLTDVLIAMEGGADTRGGRAFAWVLFTPVKSGDWWVGGRQDDHFVTPPGRFLIHVTVPEGYMNAQHKSEVHASVNAAVMAAMGGPDEPRRGTQHTCRHRRGDGRQLGCGRPDHQPECDRRNGRAFQGQRTVRLGAGLFRREETPV